MIDEAEARRVAQEPLPQAVVSDIRQSDAEWVVWMRGQDPKAFYINSPIVTIDKATGDTDIIGFPGNEERLRAAR